MHVLLYDVRFWYFPTFMKKGDRAGFFRNGFNPSQ